MSRIEPERLRGSIVALATPMDAEGAVDLEAFAGLVDWHLAAGTHGLVVAGTTGEAPSLEAGEFEDLLRLAVERAAGRVPVLAGSGTAGTAKTIAQSRRAAACGADALLVVTPYYNRPPQRGLAAHFRAVAEAVEIPVVLYNVPGRTGVDLAPETALELARHPNIVAVKEAVADMERVGRLVEGGLRVLSGDDSSALGAMEHGAAGVISVAANVVPERLAAMCDDALSGNLEAAREVDGELAALYAFLGAESNPIPVKWLLARMGRMSGALRLPLARLDPALEASGEEVFRRLNLETVD